MKKIYLGIIGIVLVASIAAIYQHKQNKMSQFSKDSQALISTLGKNLKQELITAISEKGVPEAIQTCKVKAPILTKEAHLNSPLTIRRTSLKWRNPENAPDKWEKKVLTDFEQQLAAGNPIEQLSTSEIVNLNGTKMYRHMRAIPTQGVCLNCHGEKNTLSQEVKNVLNNEYPADQAVGFTLGTIRGAFSVSRAFDN